ncbi:zinc ribbon domain-containing protein [Jonesia quinghaiensis]|uniref:zinc ribbon domain-containing protein n=1 Tax=Jonesia quinghaiensis TaxID=262806 RepID=UPI000416B45B|nr:C4-type zinc ribbon domain-containing protein [Jonesia quinghaiensis]
MPQAPVADQRRLLDLQALDLTVNQLRHKRTTIEVLQTITDITARIHDLSAALVESRTRAADLTRELTKAEDDVTQVATRTARDQQRLDSGAVSAKDAQALLHEIQTLTKRQGDLEEIQLDVMERLEAHQDALAKVEAANQQMVDALAAAEKDRDAQWQQIDADLADVLARREAIAGAIDAPLVALYEKIRANRGGLGAAELQGNQCGGCRLDLNPSDLAEIRSASAETVVRCEECGRILVRVA